MVHAHSKFDSIQDQSGHIPENEPVFLIRAQDSLSVRTLAFWISQAEAEGVSQERIKPLKMHLQSFREWPIKKLPGAPKE